MPEIELGTAFILLIISAGLMGLGVFVSAKPDSGNAGIVIIAIGVAIFLVALFGAINSLPTD